MTRASTSSPAAPGAMLGGKLRLDREIGRGAMGVVYDATDVTLGRRAAVKVMSRETIASPDQLRRFEREARAAAALTSEHAVRIHEVGSDPVPYLVMELLRGRTLEAIVGADGPPSVEVALGWMLEALDAIAEAHAGGFVHRDVKPGNLFLAERPGHPPTVKVLDFGLVKSVDPTLTVLTATGTAMGTPAYMAPEQIRAAPDVDARADVWAIGVTLFELLTGALPFPGETVPDLVRGVLDGEARDVRELRPDVPEAVAAVVARCLTKPRDGRFESGAAVARALVGAMGGTAGQWCRCLRATTASGRPRRSRTPRPDRRAAPRQAPATPRAVPPTRQNAQRARLAGCRASDLVASALALVVGGLPWRCLSPARGPATRPRAPAPPS
ncbi:MAG: serine/threonine protein kinase [Labilithrix sp.]|nr:serine/threonine protein kinase [Labilithrix sp.]